MDLKESIMELIEMLESDLTIVKSQETKSYIKNCITDLNEIL